MKQNNDINTNKLAKRKISKLSQVISVDIHNYLDSQISCFSFCQSKKIMILILMGQLYSR